MASSTPSPPPDGGGGPTPSPDHPPAASAWNTKQKGVQPANQNKKNFSDLFQNPSKLSMSTPLIPLRKPTTFKGRPAIFFSNDNIQKLSAPFRFALVGKFSHGRPPMNEIRLSIESIGLKGSLTTGRIDAKHIFFY